MRDQEEVLTTSGQGVDVQSGAIDQSERLGELLELVLDRNPFQRGRVESLEPGDRPSLTELRPLTKRDLVADQESHPPFGTNLTYPLERYTQVFQTSGTTAHPLRVLETAEDWEWWRERFANTLRIAGLDIGDRVALAFSFGPHVQFWAAKEGLEELGALGISLGGMGSVQRLQTIAEVQATTLWCTPTYALHLIEVAVEQRLESAFDSLERVLCTGEPGGSLPGVRTRIEDGLGAAVIDHAGLTEAGPFGDPGPEGHGLHIDENQFVCEILVEARVDDEQVRHGRTPGKDSARATMRLSACPAGNHAAGLGCEAERASPRSRGAASRRFQAARSEPPFAPPSIRPPSPASK